MKPIVYQPPTHMLTIRVPLNLRDVDTLDYHPVEEALQTVLAVSRLAVDGVVCDDVEVTIGEVFA